jgi:hypothetical protein
MTIEGATLEAFTDCRTSDSSWDDVTEGVAEKKLYGSVDGVPTPLGT